nr:MAG TPA_asm: hypothetical protein [Bacteriophage sp.]
MFALRINQLIFLVDYEAKNSYNNLQDFFKVTS